MIPIHERFDMGVVVHCATPRAGELCYRFFELEAVAPSDSACQTPHTNGAHRGGESARAVKLGRRPTATESALFWRSAPGARARGEFNRWRVEVGITWLRAAGSSRGLQTPLPPTPCTTQT